MSEKEGHGRNWILPEVDRLQTCRTRGAGEEMEDDVMVLEAFGTKVIGSATGAVVIAEVVAVVHSYSTLIPPFAFFPA